MQHTLKEAIESFGSKSVSQILIEACDNMMVELKSFNIEYTKTKDVIRFEFNRKEKAKKDLATCKDKHTWFFEWVIEEADRELQKARKRLPRFVNNMAHIDIEQIKSEVLIENLMDTKPISGYRDRVRYLCPLHNEKTPSFTVYKKDNTWYCFGCAKGGSVIDLYMELHDVEFSTALKNLKKH